MNPTPSPKKYTAAHRIIHWVIAFAIFGSFLTGFLRQTWMDKKYVAQFITDKVPAVDQDTAIAIAKALRADMWEWHVVFAYTIAVFIIGRLIYMLAKGIRFPNPFVKGIDLAHRIQGFNYLLFYVVVLFLMFSGFYHKFGPSGPFKGLVTGWHKLAIYWFPAFLIIHFIGFTIGEHSHDKGVVSKMIGGDFEEDKE